MIRCSRPLQVCWTAKIRKGPSWNFVGSLIVGLAFTSLASATDRSSSSAGEAIYAAQCATCHGSHGQGVAGSYERPLVGDLATHQLASLIERTMPEGEPERCVGEQAQAVAEYMQEAFYSEAAQLRSQPPRVVLSRLTVEQTRQSLADLYASFDWIPRVDGARGLTAEYFKSSNQAAENKVLERVDPAIQFNFGRQSPGLEMPADDFAIRWRGGLVVESSGSYEIIVRSSCSFVCNLGHYDRMFFDNHVQSGDKTEFRREIYLVSGRVYPFNLNFVQRKRTTELPPAAVSVSWIPPGGSEQIIPLENWAPDWFPPVFASQTQFPPDDRSYGFERGISVDRDWDESVTSAILEFASLAYSELWPAYQHRHRERNLDSRDLLAEFLGELISVAFRSRIDAEMSAWLVQKQLQAEPNDSEAIKRVLLLGLKSPRFLYPQLNSGQSESARIGSSLAWIMLDSLPVDQRLKSAIDQGELQTEQQVRSMAAYLLDDYRLRAKTRRMLHQWLHLDQFRDMHKSAEQYPGFDGQLCGDLWRSMNHFLEAVVWSETSDFRQFFSADWNYTTDSIERYYGQAWTPEGPAELGAAQPTVSEVGGAPPIPEATFTAVRRTRSHPQHHGLLTHPYLLSRLAYHDATSPIHRGIFLLKYLLGRQLKPPQDAFAPLSPDLHPDLTTRQRVELQTSPESCQACHQQINSLGFLLEHWDADGRFRSADRNLPVDARGSYVNRDGDEIQLNGSDQLSEMLVVSRDAQIAFVRRAFQHFVQQPPAAYGVETLDRLTDRFAQNNFNIRELIVDIAVTASMQSAH